MTAADPEQDADAAPARQPDRALARLLRWYPRAWRERYGEEFLAMVEDTLDGRPPGWRLHLGVAWAGLRERARRARPSALRHMMVNTGHPGRHAANTDPKPLSWLSTVCVAAPGALFWFEQNLIWTPLSADARRHARGAATADVITGLCVVVGLAIAVGALATGPALARFLRAGGWLEVRRQVTWLAVATAVATAALTQFILMARSMTDGQVVGSVSSLAWFVAAMAPLAVALWLWRQAATTMAGRLEFEPGVRAVHVVLNAVATVACHSLLPVALIWTGQVTASGWTAVLGVLLLVSNGPSDLRRLWWAGRQARRLRATAAEGR
jgi:hypothetical protein